MKKHLFLALALTFTACAPTEEITPIDEVSVPVESSNVETYTTDEFSFEYPMEWNLEGDRFYNGNQKEVFSVYTGDTMGPRCAEAVSKETFVDDLDRTWNYTVDAPDADCDIENGNQITDERTLLVDLGQKESGFLALAFYTYEVENETEAIKEFETILNSVRLK